MLAHEDYQSPTSDTSKKVLQITREREEVERAMEYFDIAFQRLTTAYNVQSDEIAQQKKEKYAETSEEQEIKTLQHTLPDEFLLREMHSARSKVSSM